MLTLVVVGYLCLFFHPSSSQNLHYTATSTTPPHSTPVPHSNSYNAPYKRPKPTVPPDHPTLLHSHPSSVPPTYPSTTDKFYKLAYVKPTFEPIFLPFIYRARISSIHSNTTIQNRYARTLLTSNMTNPHHSLAQETAFTVTIPEGAFISNFSMLIKGREYVADVKEKEEARNVYDYAVKRGQTSALIEARDANNLKVRLHMEPLENITFHLLYEELLVRKHGMYEHRVFLHPANLLDVLTVDVQVLETRNIVKYSTHWENLDLQPIFDSVGNVEHDGDKLKVIYAPSKEEQKILAERDGIAPYDGVRGCFVVRYDVERGDFLDVGEFHVMDGYFVHFMAPNITGRINKHLIMVVDLSGSMGGVKLNQTKAALKKILSDLVEEDWFTLITFQTSVWIWDGYRPFEVAGIREESPVKEIEPVKTNDGTVAFPELEVKHPAGPWHISEMLYIRHPIEATKSKIGRAIKYIDSLEADGATNIQAALEEAIKYTKRPSYVADRVSHIVFLTDGEATVGEKNATTIVDNITRLNKHNASIFSLAFGYGRGIGADWDFLKHLSLRNFGFARKIYYSADANLQVENFYQEISSPALFDVNITYIKDSDDIEGQREIIHRTKFQEYYNGSELVAYGKFVQVSNFHMKIVGQGYDGKVKIETFPLNLQIFVPIHSPDVFAQKQGKHSNFLERLFAYRTIKRLIQDILIAKTKEEKKQLKSRAVELALKYNFVTEVTSLVVVKPGPGEQVKKETTNIWNSIGQHPGVSDRLEGLIFKPLQTTVPSTTTETTMFDETSEMPTHVTISDMPNFDETAKVRTTETTPFVFTNIETLDSDLTTTPSASTYRQPTYPRTTTGYPQTTTEYPQTTTGYSQTTGTSGYQQAPERPSKEPLRPFRIPTFDLDSAVIVDPEFLNSAILLNQLVPPPQWENITTDYYGTASFPNGTTIELGYQEDELPTYDTCTTASGESGTCRYIQYCYTDRYMLDFETFWKDSCTVESPSGGVYAGVCCPNTLTATEPPPHKFVIG